MQAWQFTGAGEPLVLADLPVPTAAADEVLIDIRAAGLCHTDVGILRDPGWAVRVGPLPLTLGHEVAGVVVAVGDQVTGDWMGMRVGLTPAGRTRPGLGRDGGYAAFCTAYPEDLIPIPSTVSFAQAAAGTDAGKTGWHAVHCRASVQAGQRVAIAGLGGIGQVATRLAVLREASVIVAEPRKDLWRLARELGAETTVASLDELEGEEIDTVIDFAGTGTTTQQAIAAVRPRGTVVQVGLAALEAAISTRDLVTKQVSLIGSSGGCDGDIANVYALMESGDLNPLLPRIRFEDIPDGLERLRRGEVVGRLVAVYDATDR